MVAGLISSVLMSVIWYLASPKAPTEQGPADLAALRTPVTLTLVTGRSVTGELQGTDSLCSDWTSALQAAPETAVVLPDGSRVTGGNVQSVSMGRSAVAGALKMGKVSVCPETLTIRVPGSPVAGPGVLGDAAGAASSMKGALNSLTEP